MLKQLQDKLLAISDDERSLLALAYYQTMTVRVLLYFATEKGKRRFAPVPAMIAAAVVKAVYEYEYGIKPHFLPQDRLDRQYPSYPRQIFDEGFWWDHNVMHTAQNEMGALRSIPKTMRIVIKTIISEYSVLHPNGLAGMQMASWWPTRLCGNNRGNLQVCLTKKNIAEAECYLLRLGDEDVAWCEAVGKVMVNCMDSTLVDGRCLECRP